MITLGNKKEVAGAEGLRRLAYREVPRGRDGRPSDMPKLQPGERLIAGFDRRIYETLYVVETLADAQYLWDEYAKGLASDLYFYAGADPGFVGALRPAAEVERRHRVFRYQGGRRYYLDQVFTAEEAQAAQQKMMGQAKEGEGFWVIEEPGARDTAADPLCRIGYGDPDGEHSFLDALRAESEARMIVEQANKVQAGETPTGREHLVHRLREPRVGADWFYRRAE